MVDSPLGPLRWVEQGSGQDQVVLIHGFGGDAENWRFNMTALSARHRVIAVDLPGHGESTKQVGSDAVSAIVDTLLHVLAVRAPGPAHLVGHSLGGLIAAEIALREPSRCSSLFLIAPAGFGQAADGRYVQEFVDADEEVGMRAVLDLLFERRGVITSSIVREVLRGKSAAGAEAALRTMSRSLLVGQDQHLVDYAKLAEVPFPTAALWGADDRVIACPQGPRLGETIPVKVLHGVGHSPHVEAANRVNRILADFWDTGVLSV